MIPRVVLKVKTQLFPYERDYLYETSGILPCIMVRYSEKIKEEIPSPYMYVELYTF